MCDICTGSSILNRCYRPDIRCAISLQWGRLSIERRQRRRALAATLRSLPPAPSLLGSFDIFSIRVFRRFRHLTRNTTRVTRRIPSSLLTSRPSSRGIYKNAGKVQGPRSFHRGCWSGINSDHGDGSTRGVHPSARTRAHRGSRASSYDRNVGAGRGLDKFPFLRKYL